MWVLNKKMISLDQNQDNKKILSKSLFFYLYYFYRFNDL